MHAIWTANHSSITLQFYGHRDKFWSIVCNASGREWTIKAPAFEIDGRSIRIELMDIAESQSPRRLHNHTTEYRLHGVCCGEAGLALDWIVRVADDSPVMRFHYELFSTAPRTLTKQSGSDSLTYMSVSLDGLPAAKEIRFSEFVEMVHSFCLTERPIDERHYESGIEVMGPILTAGDGSHQALIAYEHGSQVPDAFIHFKLKPGKEVVMEAVKGNYYDRYPLGPDRSFRTIWMQAAFLQGDEDQLAAAYRTFVLHYQSLHTESRQPYIFYNTWNYQERNRNWYGKKYLADMHLDRMLDEIDAAYRMGIEVFVIDTGWYEKTGDWRVNSSRFPDDLRRVKSKLDVYNMKLGLWFNPTAAALTSTMLAEHQDCIMSWDGEKSKPRSIWETEESVSLCLVSRYSDAFADELIRLVKEIGVTYFKWDAVDQYGCNDPGHQHGDERNSPQERGDSYAFQQIAYMTRVVDKLCEACPEAIVDFDITEGHRSVGLSFLSAGKYFLVNNGPYFHNYNVPIDMDKDNWNLFFYPGPARGWICRTPLSYDKWFPSILFLTHYLPDDPQDNQLITIGSLILGQNGIWGDLPAVSDEGVKLLGDLLQKYKRVRLDITESRAVREGEVGGSPEVHEKIWDRTGKGAVVIFSSTPGVCRYITHAKPAQSVFHTDGVVVSWDHAGRAVVQATFAGPSARIILFG